MNRNVIGIDIGGTTVKLGIFEAGGTLVTKWEIPTRKAAGGKDILPDIAASVRQKTAELKGALSDYAGAGLGMPGPVLPDGHVDFCVNLGWGAMNPQEILSGLLDGLPVKSGNDANVAALGEAWQGGGRGYKNLVMVTLGTGVGGGVILDGRIWPGTRGVGGEIGHMHILDGETERCNCGGYGCLEQAASATGFVRIAKRTLASGTQPSALRNIPEPTAKDVLDLAKKGDALALESVETSCRYLGWALASVTMVLDPEAYLIGGGVSRAGTFLTEKIRRYHDELSPMSTKKPKILLATLGNDAGIYGAAKLALG
ncbi:MAG: ROK family glucokinase [Lachnospiraceae bacterium]|jgi:glucokinase|nr:ROK family glucokinase [Lachnospiraceae bacterium]